MLQHELSYMQLCAYRTIQHRFFVSFALHSFYEDGCKEDNACIADIRLELQKRPSTLLLKLCTMFLHASMTCGCGDTKRMTERPELLHVVAGASVCAFLALASCFIEFLFLTQ